MEGLKPRSLNNPLPPPHPPTPGVPDSLGLGQGLRICISSKFSGDIDAVGLGSTYWVRGPLGPFQLIKPLDLDLKGLLWHVDIRTGLVAGAPTGEGPVQHNLLLPSDSLRRPKRTFSSLHFLSPHCKFKTVVGFWGCWTFPLNFLEWAAALSSIGNLPWWSSSFRARLGVSQNDSELWFPKVTHNSCRDS